VCLEVPVRHNTMYYVLQAMYYVYFTEDLCIRLPSLEGAERKKFAPWANLAKEPDCRGDLWWVGWWV
jgi:hypothetical protein